MADASLWSVAGIWSSVSSSAADASTGLFGTIVPSLLGVTSHKLSLLLQPLSNLAYVILMLIGFAYLPANFMLVLGIISVFFGPTLLVYSFKLLGSIISTAAYAPLVIILGAWLLLFLRSAIFQRVALALSLDVDGDGRVDMLDVLAYLATSPAGALLRLPELHAELRKWRGSKPDQRLDKIEAMLTKQQGGEDGVAYAAKGGNPYRLFGKKAPKAADAGMGHLRGSGLV